MRAWWGLGLWMACQSAPEPEVLGPPEPSMPGIEAPSARLDAELAASLASKGEGYAPRTDHLQDDRPTFTNRLIRETSPYLLQHAHNPVNWYPWGTEAFDRARERGVPVLLSVGYSTCHWCHVMERESFEDLEIAAFINAHFVPIKVDREERPDVDDVYMAAVNVLTGRGGWPMTVVMTPDGKPFFAGTYFPPRDGDRNRPKGFLTILRELEALYRDSPDKVVSRAQEVTSKVTRRAAGSKPASDVPDTDALVSTARALAGKFDPEWGGFAKKPKFPRPSTLLYLLRYHRRTQDPHALHMVTHTLDRMAGGGIHDHVAGGFHRYSVDAQWHVPHFEKMLYDNAQLSVAYTAAWQLTKSPRYEEVVRSTLGYLIREMQAPEGGFYSATDADSPGPDGEPEEGLYFEWSWQQLVDALGSDGAARWGEAYGVTRGAGRTVLQRADDWTGAAARRGESVEAFETALKPLRTRLREVRSERPPPLRDDKLIVSWNGLAISALSRAGMAFGEPEWITLAEKAATRLTRAARQQDGRLHRTLKDGKPRHEGVLDDYAFLAQGLLDLYEATGKPIWFGEAQALQRVQDSLFADENGGYFLTSREGEKLLTRPRPGYDGAEPSGNSVSALNLLRLASYTSDDAYGKRARALFRSFGNNLSRGGSSVPWMASALDYEHDRALELLIIVPKSGAGLGPMLDALRETYVPNRVVAVVPEAQVAMQSERIRVLGGKVARDGKTTAYVCERGACQEPVTDPGPFLAQITAVKPLSPKAPAPLKPAMGAKVE